MTLLPKLGVAVGKSVIIKLVSVFALRLALAIVGQAIGPVQVVATAVCLGLLRQ